MILHSSVENKTKKRRKDKPSKYQTALFFGCFFFFKFTRNTKHKSHEDERHKSPSSPWLCKHGVVNPCCVGVPVCV